MNRKILSLLVCITLMSSLFTGMASAETPVPANMRDYSLDYAESVGWTTDGGFAYNLNSNGASLRGASGSTAFYQGRTFAAPMDYTMFLIGGNKADSPLTTKSQITHIYFHYADTANWYRIAVSGSPSDNSYKSAAPLTSTFAVGTVKLEKSVAGTVTTLYDSEVDSPLPSYVKAADGTIVSGTTLEQVGDLQTAINNNPRFKWVNLGHRFNTTIKEDGSISCWVSKDRNLDNIKLRDLFVDVPDTGNRLTSGYVGVGAVGTDMQMSGITVTDPAGTYDEFVPYGVFSTDKYHNYNRTYVAKVSQWDSVNVPLLLNVSRTDDGLNDRWQFSDGSSLISKNALSDNQEVVAYMKSTSTATDGVMKFYLGYQDADNHYYLAIVGKAGSQTINLMKVVDGQESVLASYDGIYTKFVNNDYNWVMVRLVMDGQGNIGAQAGHKGELINLVTVKDTTFLSGKVGFATTGCTTLLRNVTVRAKVNGVDSDNFNTGSAAYGAASIAKLTADGKWTYSGPTNFLQFNNRPFRSNQDTGNGSTWGLRYNYTPTGSYTFGFDYGPGGGGASGWGGTQAFTVNFNPGNNGINATEGYTFTLSAPYNAAPFVRLQRSTGNTTTVGAQLDKASFTATDWQYDLWNASKSGRFDFSVELNGHVTVWYTPASDGIKRVLIDADPSLYTDNNNNGHGAMRGPRPGGISFTFPSFAAAWFDNFTFAELPTMITNNTLTCENKAVTSLQGLAGKTLNVATRIVRNTPSDENAAGMYAIVLRDADGKIVDMATASYGLTWDHSLASTITAQLTVPEDAATKQYSLTGYYMDRDTIVPYTQKVVYPLTFTPAE